MAARLTFAETPPISLAATGRVYATRAGECWVVSGPRLVAFDTDRVHFEHEAEGAFAAVCHDGKRGLIYAAENPRPGKGPRHPPRLHAFTGSGDRAKVLDLGQLLGGADDVREVTDAVFSDDLLTVVSSTAERPDAVALLRIDPEAEEVVGSRQLLDRSDRRLVPVRLQRSSKHLYVHNIVETQVFDAALEPVCTLPLEGDRLAYDDQAELVAFAGPGGIRLARGDDGFRKQRFVRYALKGRAVPNDHAFAMGPAAEWLAVAFGDTVHVYDGEGQHLAASGVGAHVSGFATHRAPAGSTELLIASANPRVALLG